MKRTRIAGGKGRSSSITTNKNMRGHLKRGGNREGGIERGGGGGEEMWWCVREEGKKWKGEKKVVGRGEET